MHEFVRIACRELAHRQAKSCEDIYGECRDTEQACLRGAHGELCMSSYELSAVSLLTGRQNRAKAYTANAVTPSKLACEVRMANCACLRFMPS